MAASKEIRFDLINPTSPLWRVKTGQKPRNSKMFRFSMLPSLYVAASMPSYVNTRIFDEDVEPVNFDTDAELIGISFMTYNAPRAYELADRFREMGKKVIFGGYHPSFMPEEALEHADAICMGESEINVPRIIEDYRKGNLQDLYKSELLDLKELPQLNRKLIQQNAYVTPNAMQATRGCVFECEFCSVAAFNQYKIRTRPIARVLEELQELGRQILFMDDNIALNKNYARELFKAMKPLNKRWYSQCGISIAQDEELLQLAYESGCRGLFIGFESLSDQNLDSWKKYGNKKADYLQAVKAIHQQGISIFAAFVFGGDNDGPDVFQNTLDFLLEANIEAVQTTRLTPFPGTPLFERMDKAGRILTKDWSYYDFFHIVVQPVQMTPWQLHHGTAWIQKEFYSYKNITRRVRKSFTYLDRHTMFNAVIPMNLGYRIKLSKYKAFEEGKAFDPLAN